MAIAVVLLVVAGALAWSGGQQATTAPATAPTASAAPSQFQEAPMLAALVSAGKLPPVKERLPPNPVVIKPIESIGRYGGTANLFTMNSRYPQIFSAENFIGWEPILRSERDLTFGHPNLAESYEWSNEGKTLTLKLRQGLRWSDGHPFTADDIEFYFKYQAPYNDLNPVPPDSWLINGKLLTAEKVDMYTIKLHAPGPAYTIIHAMSHANGAQPGEWIGFFQAAHYAKQFHAAFLGEAEATRKAKELGFESWQKMYRDKTYSCYGIQLAPGQAPTMTAYVCVERTPSRWIWQRNPYYWKVDPEGRQLPYIDQLVVNLIGASQETLNGKIITGEVDWANGTLQDMPLYLDNQAKANNRIIMLTETGISGFEMNLTAADPVLRTLFQDVRFREAMSLAINREEVIDLFLMGLAKPAGWYADPSSPYYEASVVAQANRFAKYDPARANTLLDQAGLSRRDSANFRLRPDGQRLRIIYEYVGETVTSTIELFVSYWRAIGVEVIAKPQTFALLSERIVANEVQMYPSHTVDGLEPLFVYHPHPVVPYSWSWIGIWGTRWAQWYTTRGEQGEKPPVYIQNLFDWWDQMRVVDAQKRVEYGRMIFRAHAENQWKIGLYTVPPAVRVVSNELKNTPPEKSVYNGWNWMRSMTFDPPQMYFTNRAPLTAAHPLVAEPYGK
jgi:peptide/nickel transport system substrate-binding protein